MCGRYQLGMTWEELLAHYALVRRELDRGMFVGAAHTVPEAPGCTLPWYNQAPGQPSPTVLQVDGQRVYRQMRWGFAPTWLARRGKDPWKARPLVNAKSEEARDKRTWSKPMAERRCLVPSTGFYEWVRRGAGRYPLHFRPVDGQVLTLGGIWTEHKRGDDRVACMAILTTGPNKTMAPVHDRMPVILGSGQWDRWLDPTTPADEIDALCAPAPADRLQAAEAHTALNSWRASGAEVLEADWEWRERP